MNLLVFLSGTALGILLGLLAGYDIGKARGRMLRNEDLIRLRDARADRRSVERSHEGSGSWD